MCRFLLHVHILFSCRQELQCVNYLAVILLCCTQQTHREVGGNDGNVPLNLDFMHRIHYLFAEMTDAAEAYFISDPRLPAGTLFDQDDVDAQKSVEHVSWAADLDSGARREAVSVNRRLSKTGTPINSELHREFEAKLGAHRLTPVLLNMRQ